MKSVQDQDAKITIAEENLRSAQNALEHSQRMFRKGYISALDLESQKFQVQRAQLELDSARTAKDVLVKFTKLKMMQELESKRDSAEAKMRSEGASFDLEESRLKRLETQLEKCVITAPADGMAVYANEQGVRFGGSQQAQIEEGAAVRERQTMLRLPDLAQMQVKVNVHESKVEMLSRAWKAAIDAGHALRARIRIQDLELQGALTNIANQPEPSGWWAGQHQGICDDHLHRRDAAGAASRDDGRMRNPGGSSPGCPHDSRGCRGRTAWRLLRLDEDADRVTSVARWSSARRTTSSSK